MLESVKKEKKEEGIWVQKRDLEILRFCLEMKFADIESLHQMYFGASDQEMFAARKRIQKLEESGYLKSTSLLSGTTKKFYLTTPKGHREVLKSASDVEVPRPVNKLSLVTFEHDLGVLKSRRALEEQGRATSWRSERLLKHQAQIATSRLKRDFMPDAIFTSKQRKVCAFEFENKPKSEDQLREKILRLQALMSESDPVFEACLFITSTENLKTKIKKTTDLIPNRFVVQSKEELFGISREI